MWGRQSLSQLAVHENKSARWIKSQIDVARVDTLTLTPEAIVVAADTTFWGREYGVCVFRSPKLKKNLWWQEVTRETPEIYRQGREALETGGWMIQAVVIDGRPGVARVFSDLPVQVCQFHQVKI